MQPQQGLFSQYSNPQEMANRIMQMTPEELSNVDHTSLLQARKFIPKERQGDFSPYEHQAYIREAVYDNPDWAPLAAIGALAYQPYKMVVGDTRSAPSMLQTKQGLIGVKQGLMQRLKEIGDTVGSMDYSDPFGFTIK